MFDILTVINDVQALVCAPDGKKLASEDDALELIGEALQSGAELVVIPVERFTGDFFQLTTGLLGQVLQKFVNYRRRLVILGDISQYLTDSRAFRDFVYEANHGNQVWFVTSQEELNRRLGGLS